MILVDDAGGEWPMIGHAPWNGCNLADFVMPFFLFIVGMSISLALKVSSSDTLSPMLSLIRLYLYICNVYINTFILLQRIPDRCIATKKVILRTLKLIFWGLLFQGQLFI